MLILTRRVGETLMIGDSVSVTVLDAGGHLISDADAPSFWVLGDAEGNEACVCTWQGRSGTDD